MSQAIWTDIYGTDATVTTVNGKVQVSFFPENLPNSGLGNVAGTYTLTTSNAPEKSLAALIISNSKRTFVEADNNVTISKNLSYATIEQRNGTSKLKESYTTSVYASAAGVPSSIDPDNV